MKFKGFSDSKKVRKYVKETLTFKAIFSKSTF